VGCGRQSEALPSRSRVPILAGMSEPTEHSRFETVLHVRPDDIDMNRHVHNSHYFDYVLAARYDQMARCYKMSMEEFAENGFGWVVNTAHLHFKRPLRLGDSMVVTTWVETIGKSSVKVQFTIKNQATGKLCTDGWFDYTMVSLTTGRAAAIPDWIMARYSV
jgi:YbgC/YbaW family acyl-CoA thioester hydrolase